MSFLCVRSFLIRTLLEYYNYKAYFFYFIIKIFRLSLYKISINYMMTFFKVNQLRVCKLINYVHTGS